MTEGLLRAGAAAPAAQTYLSAMRYPDAMKKPSVLGTVAVVVVLLAILAAAAWYAAGSTPPPR